MKKTSYFKRLRIKLRHFWYSTWIRKDEFHRSLDIDFDYMMILDSEDVQKYLSNLNKRRRISHERDLST
jgi:hypothetical protein